MLAVGAVCLGMAAEDTFKELICSSNSFPAVSNSRSSAFACFSSRPATWYASSSPFRSSALALVLETAPSAAVSDAAAITGAHG